MTTAAIQPKFSLLLSDAVTDGAEELQRPSKTSMSGAHAVGNLKLNNVKVGVNTMQVSEKQHADTVRLSQIFLSRMHSAHVH